MCFCDRHDNSSKSALACSILLFLPGRLRARLGAGRCARGEDGEIYRRSRQCVLLSTRDTLRSERPRRSLSITLTSKSATVGDRTDLLAFEGEGAQTVLWDVTNNGDLWRYSLEPIAPDVSDPIVSSGKWICYPATDTSDFTATTVDTTILITGGVLRTRVTYNIVYVGSDSITLNGMRWAIHKVRYQKAYDRWINGSPRSDSYQTSGVRSYLTDLGVLAEQRDTVTTPGYNYQLNFLLYSAAIK
jgi:hypothetical protein